MNEQESNAFLETKMGKNDAGAATVGEYLASLLIEVWREDEGFSGKRPFGNSGWKSEIYQCLAAAKIIEGSVSYEEPDNGYQEWDISYDEEKRADKMIYEAITNTLAR